MVSDVYIDTFLCLVGVLLSTLLLTSVIYSFLDLVVLFALFFSCFRCESSAH